MGDATRLRVLIVDDSEDDARLLEHRIRQAGFEPEGTAVKLTITHTVERDPSKFIDAVSGGWPKVVSNLKSLLETGTIAIQQSNPKYAARSASA